MLIALTSTVKLSKKKVELKNIEIMRQRETAI